jgi:hypothetical protein
VALVVKPFMIMDMPYGERSLDMNGTKTSPCIGICKLNVNNICVGCNRTITEIRDAYEKTRK